MEQGQPSFTAIGSAMLRAAHLLWDAPPKIFEDTFALSLSGCADERELRQRYDAILGELIAKFGRYLALAAVDSARSPVVMRSRYVEEELDLAIKHGVAQYVILGAGLDSFAYRKTEALRILRVFEVDHPATQTWKRARLQELGVATPTNLVLVPLDFERQGLIETLRMHGYRDDRAGFFSWLGVTVYLRPDAIFDTLRTVASMARGSEIIFQYLLPPTILEGQDRRIQELFAAVGAARGEPYLTFFEPAQLAADLRDLGFTDLWDLTPEEANGRYFANRTDPLRITAEHNFMKARV